MTNKRKKELEFDKYGLPMPPKSLKKAVLETSVVLNKKLPKNVSKAIKKIKSRIPPKPPGEMPTSIRMNKVNRGKIQESLGKSVRTGSDKPKKFDSGGLIGNQKKDLKAIPEGNKGLPKLPTKVRNKIGFLKEGGPVGRIPKSARRKMGFKSKSANTISDKDVALMKKALTKPFKGKIDTDKEKLVSENGKTMVVKKAKGGSIQVSGTNFSGVY